MNYFTFFSGFLIGICFYASFAYKFNRERSFEFEQKKISLLKKLNAETTEFNRLIQKEILAAQNIRLDSFRFETLDNISLKIEKHLKRRDKKIEELDNTKHIYDLDDYYVSGSDTGAIGGCAATSSFCG